MKKGKPEWSDDFNNFSDEELSKRELFRVHAGKETYSEISGTELLGSSDGNRYRLTMDEIHQILMGLRPEV